VHDVDRFSLRCCCALQSRPVPSTRIFPPREPIRRVRVPVALRAIEAAAEARAARPREPARAARVPVGKVPPPGRAAKAGAPVEEDRAVRARRGWEMPARTMARERLLAREVAGVLLLQGAAGTSDVGAGADAGSAGAGGTSTGGAAGTVVVDSGPTADSAGAAGATSDGSAAGGPAGAGGASGTAASAGQGGSSGAAGSRGSAGAPLLLRAIAATFAPRPARHISFCARAAMSAASAGGMRVPMILAKR
jgi:hypothetical protein